MKEITKTAVLASTLGLLAGQGMESGWLRPARAKQPKEFTHFDQERLDKAQAKRERKGKKLVERGHL